MYFHMVCCNDPCTEHRHRWHPGMGHCVTCLDEENEGYSNNDWTFRSNKATWKSDLRCCCRDQRIGMRPLIPDSVIAAIEEYYKAPMPKFLS
jgi:hypothetical protein